MDNSVLLSGRPYGGCSIIYRKSLGMCITPLISCSDRFCGVKLCDSSGLSFLIVCVYMPAQCSSTSTDEYLNTLVSWKDLFQLSNVMLILQVNEKSYELKRGNIGMV